jgi:outer membrane immunogenic protein
MKNAILAASLLLMSTAAHAADAVVADPILEAPAVFSWSGAYIGVQAGYAWGDSTADYPLQGPPGSTVVDPDGWLAGAYVGYNHQMANNVVLGVDADIAYVDVDGSGVYTDVFGPLVGDTDSLQLNWSAAIRGRLGYAMGRLLPYVAGGVAFGGIDTQTVSANPNLVGSWSETYIGYTIGGGVDFAATDRIVVRAEYRFTDFGSETFQSSGPITAHSVDLSTHDVRFGLALRF